MDINQLTKTIRNYKKSLDMEVRIEKIAVISSIIILLIWMGIAIIFPSIYKDNVFMVLIILLSMFLSALVIQIICPKTIVKKINKSCVYIDNLYAKTMLESFLHYYPDNKIDACQPKYMDKISKLLTNIPFNNSQYSSEIINMLLVLDNKIQLLIDEDNKVNGFGYVVSKVCYDVIIEKINKTESKILEIKNQKKNEMTNHFRNIVN